MAHQDYGLSLGTRPLDVGNDLIVVLAPVVDVPPPTATPSGADEVEATHMDSGIGQKTSRALVAPAVLCQAMDENDDGPGLPLRGPIPDQLGPEPGMRIGAGAGSHIAWNLSLFRVKRRIDHTAGNPTIADVHLDLLADR